MEDIISRLRGSSPNESSHELYCRCLDAAEELDELRKESKRLKKALFFWLPNIPAVENECTERMANDAALLIGHEGRIDDSAEQRGWVVLMPNMNPAKHDVLDSGGKL